MKWSWKIGRFAGIEVYMHATFLLLIGWVALIHWQEGASLAAVISGVGFILALFLCVVLHEYGHALTARKYGIKTRDITLLPIGGVARLERMPDEPRQELWVALAGPAVNIVIAGLLYTWLIVTNGLRPVGELSVSQGPFLERLMITNLFLAGFNMIPAFPMDGGRVLRALLATRQDYTRATQNAARLGQGLAFILGFIGLLTNPFLLFIALFVWIGAAQESSMTQMKSALGGIPVTKAMLTDFNVLVPTDTLDHTVELILTGSQQDFPVVVDGRVVGVLLRRDLIIALRQKDQTSPVSEVMRRDFQIVDSFEMLDVAFAHMKTSECHTMPVMHQNRLVGLITMDNIGEFFAIQDVLRSSSVGNPKPKGFTL